MPLLGSHLTSFESLRALAIPCHALDLCAYELLFTSTHTDKGDRTKSAYEAQFTGQLLALAICLRTKLYQGYDPHSTISYLSHCRLLLTCGDAAEESERLSMRDVSDKIIEAVTVRKDLKGEVERASTTLGGESPDGMPWELSLCVNLFAEAVLNWIRDVGDAQLAKLNSHATLLPHSMGDRPQAPS